MCLNFDGQHPRTAFSLFISRLQESYNKIALPIYIDFFKQQKTIKVDQVLIFLEIGSKTILFLFCDNFFGFSYEIFLNLTPLFLLQFCLCSICWFCDMRWWGIKICFKLCQTPRRVWLKKFDKKFSYCFGPPPKFFFTSKKNKYKFVYPLTKI